MEENASRAIVVRQPDAAPASCSCMFDHLCSLDTRDVPLEFPAAAAANVHNNTTEELRHFEPVEWYTYHDEGYEERDTVHELHVPEEPPAVEEEEEEEEIFVPPVEEPQLDVKPPVPRRSIMHAFRRKFTKKSRVHSRSQSCRPREKPSTRITDLDLAPRTPAGDLEVANLLPLPVVAEDYHQSDEAPSTDVRRSVDFDASEPPPVVIEREEEPLSETTYSEVMERSRGTPKSPLALWLAERNLARYEESLARMGVKRLADLAYVTDDDLINMDVDAKSRQFFHVHVVA